MFWTLEILFKTEFTILCSWTLSIVLFIFKTQRFGHWYLSPAKTYLLGPNRYSYSLFLDSKSFPKWLSDQNRMCILVGSHSCYMPSPSHPAALDHCSDTWLGVQDMFFSAPCSQATSICVSPLMSGTCFHTNTESQVKL
jgi:hypothetical protein